VLFAGGAFLYWRHTRQNEPAQVDNAWRIKTADGARLLTLESPYASSAGGWRCATRSPASGSRA